ncbi:MAG: hypothetical protein ACI4PU_00780, partial [Intestinibacter sp.]
LKKETKIEDKKVYNCKAKIKCSDFLNVRENRPDKDGNLAPVKFTLPENAEVKLGYVLNGWGGIYTDTNYGFVNVKYLELDV